MSRTMIENAFDPSDLAASTNSRLRSEITWPRITRPRCVQLKKMMTQMLSGRLGPRTDTSASAHSRKGTLMTRSMIRLSKVSIHPPKYPEIVPTVMPISAAASDATTPTMSETWAP